jgi:hypothetical protein
LCGGGLQTHTYCIHVTSQGTSVRGYQRGGGLWGSRELNVIMHETLVIILSDSQSQQNLVQNLLVLLLRSVFPAIR